MNRELKEWYISQSGDLREFKKLDAQPEVGLKFSFSKRINEIDVQLFGLISGDLNPIHFSKEAAEKTKFGDRVVHGMLTTSLVSAALAMMKGTVVLLETSFKYTSPVRIGDEVVVDCEIVEKKGSVFKVNVSCKVKENIVAEGWAKVLIWP